jgi:serine/threonine protein kinase
MASASTSIQAGFEPIPGYVLREKLGSGGYGEVWLAEAPGGLKKAIKFVHGDIDEDRANNELKSLQRIRQVNHPFILSLERIEVIEGQLLIVTELAQGTLYDRYLEFREKGFAGISREHLLSYLKDAADGLDFLCQQHDLQHLDVKPANLLLVADRIKVADFGLIKDIQSNSLSMMAGLTPTYAAPEMFDGRPGRFSDQYSLAIVYQEMLTGTLPFRGRTTAQLANEHLQKAPNLESIPPLERPILSKALSKKPQLRFSDCRELIDSLERCRKQSAELDEKESANSVRIKPRSTRSSSFNQPLRPSQVATRSVPVSDAKWTNASDKGSIDFTPAQITETTASSSTGSGSIQILPPMNVLDVPLLDSDSSFDLQSIPSLSKSTGKSLTIGIGGVGIQSLIEMRKLCQQSHASLEDLTQRGFLIIDSDEEAIQSAVSPDRDGRLPYHCTIHIPLKSPQHYRQSDKVSFTQISRRWVYNIPRSLKTEGVRPLGMLAFLDRASYVFESIREALAEVARSQGEAAALHPIDVQVVASAHGGTGSAISSEVGFFVRQIAADFGLEVHLELLLTCAIPHSNGAMDLPIATALACLTELNHYHKTEGLHPSIDGLPASNAIHQAPFDHVTLIYGGQFGNTGDLISTVEQAGRYLWSLAETKLGETLRQTRQADEAKLAATPDHDITPWISTVATRKTEISSAVSEEVSAARICLPIALPWLAALDSIVTTRSRTERTSSLDSRTQEQIDFLIGDMFRTNRWTAQAWVQQCMQSIIDQPLTLDDGSIASNDLDASQKTELDIISDSLAIDSSETYQSVSRLVAKTRATLITSIVNKFLTSPSAWTTIREITDRTANQFRIHANSLHVVAERLSEKHDDTLEKIYQGEQGSTIELDQQLQAMAIEARFHSIAAKMLERMAEHVTHLEEIWLHECTGLREDLMRWIEQLCSEIGMRWDDSPETQSASISLRRLNLDEDLARQLKKRILDQACSRLLPKSSNPASLEEVFKFAFTHFAQRSKKPSPSATLNSQENVDITNSIDRNPTTEAKADSPSDLLGSTTKGSHAKVEPTNLANELIQTRPYLVDFGGAVRNILVVPQEVVEQLQPEQRAELAQHQVTFIQTEQGECELVCIGERLALSEIIDRVWMPSSQNWELTNRVFARVDIEWQPIQ